MAKKCNKSAEERRQIVLAMLRHDATVPELARRCGVSENTLYRWRDQFLEGGLAGLRSGNKPTEKSREVADLKKQVAERDRVIGELTIANRILKKTSDGLL